MAQEASLVSLGELLEETGETENDDKILERLKNQAQEHLPEGWTAWKVTRLTKEEIFGDCIGREILDQLEFALPIDQLARAFIPDTTRLSQQGYRDLKMKMLDWAFTRALITSPPPISNKIRGSAAATQLFNQAVRWESPISKNGANGTSSIEVVNESKTIKRRRVSPDPGSSADCVAKSKRIRVINLEHRMNNMFSTLMDRINSIPASHSQAQTSSIEIDDSSDEENNRSAPSRSESPGDWQAPPMVSDLVQSTSPELEFLPEVKVEPGIPAPTELITSEGIACQKFGTEAWNHIRYKDAEERLYASPVFSTLKINTELNNLGIQTPESRILSKYDGVLGTIVHGLLCQRKALAKEVKNLSVKFPESTEDLKKLLSEHSDFKRTSDDLLGYVCGQRAETFDLRRRTFKARNEALSSMLQQIPPSSTHLFQVNKLSKFIKNNGGVLRIFPSHFGRFPDVKHTFQQPRQRQHSGGQVKKRLDRKNQPQQPRN